jgi:hypothetical protein
MAATYLDIQEWPRNVVAGFQHQFRLTARNADGTVDPGFVGTVTWASSDAAATLPSPNPYTFAGADAGTKLFVARMRTNGARTLSASSGALAAATARCTVAARPPGLGLDDFGILPYGDAAGSIGVGLASARAVSTREVDVTTSNLVQDNSPFLVGDALNPNTWMLQRLDTFAFLHVVEAVQVGTYTYRLLLLEELGPAAATHRVSSTTLLDVGGSPIVSPRSADFLGLLDANTLTVADRLANSRVRTKDFANPQLPGSTFLAGTLQLDPSGDYKLESGPALVRKLILRRLMSSPGDFFHLPNYGIGFRVKEPLPVADLVKLKAAVEAQCAKEPEVEAASATLSLSTGGVLNVAVAARLRKTGEQVDIAYTTGNAGLVV